MATKRLLTVMGGQIEELDPGVENVGTDPSGSLIVAGPKGLTMYAAGQWVMYQEFDDGVPEIVKPKLELITQ